MKWLAILAAFFIATPALAQSPGFTGWQSGIFDTGTNAVIMPADATNATRNYLKHIFCDATSKIAPGVVQINIKVLRNGTLTTIGYWAVLAGQTDGINFDPPLWGDLGSAITMTYKAGGGPAHCMWLGFTGQ